MATILLADDEPDVLQVTAARLRAGGHQVDTAADGGEAWSKIQYAPPDLVILDVMLPKLDGWCICRQLKEHPQLQRIPVILLSGLIDVETDVPGSCDYAFAKPVDGATLLAKIDELLRRTHAS